MLSSWPLLFQKTFFYQIWFLQNNTYVGSIKKLVAINFGEFFIKADSYRIDFPANASPEKKMLLIISGLMIDYQNFEDNKDDTPPPHPYYY